MVVVVGGGGGSGGCGGWWRPGGECTNFGTFYTSVQINVSEVRQML